MVRPGGSMGTSRSVYWHLDSKYLRSKAKHLGMDDHTNMSELRLCPSLSASQLDSSRNQIAPAAQRP